jgi:hypothetical protein
VYLPFFFIKNIFFRSSNGTTLSLTASMLRGLFNFLVNDFYVVVYIISLFIVFCCLIIMDTYLVLALVLPIICISAYTVKYKYINTENIDKEDTSMYKSNRNDILKYYKNNYIIIVKYIII